MVRSQGQGNKSGESRIMDTCIAILKKSIAVCAAAILLLTCTFSGIASAKDNNSKTGAAAGNVAAASVIKDGEYEPDGFGWTGGSGRLEYIKCDKITVKDGNAKAHLEFASDKYDKVKVSGETFEREGKGNSKFTVPVNINANTRITGRTTAMSQAHWIDYSIYVFLDRGEGISGKTDVSKDVLDEDAPQVFGLSEGTRQDAKDADLFRIFEYDGGYTLLEIDVAKRSVLSYDQEGENRYQRNVVSYLIAEEGSEIPAGVDSDLIIINKPAAKQFVIEDVKDVPYQKIVTSEAELAVLPASQIKGFLWFGKSKAEAAEELEKRMDTLGIPLIFDRTDSEKGKDNKAQWENVYEILK